MKELTKKQYIIIGIVIVVLLLVISIITFLVIHNSSSSKLKRYLISEEYKCNKTTCVKEHYTVIYQINYHNGVLIATSPTYELTINKDNIYYLNINTNKSCTYDKKNNLSNIKESNIQSDDFKCTSYLEEINKVLTDYNNIIINSKVNYQKLK